MKNYEVFGKYLLLERLAAGGMAEIFLARSVGMGKIAKFVAVKRILPQYSDNQEFIDMFKEEARIAMNLNHGNIVPIFDFGMERNQFFLAMEYVEGQNLRQILNHLKVEAKNFSIEQCVYIIKQVAAGLDHAHRCLDNATGKPLNITHRDMSPQNVMVSFEGEVKVVDFGIAKAESEMEHTRAGTIKGKFGYMSPEQAEGFPVDSRTDIFSLGIVLWELLARDRLFTASSEAATLKKIKECQIPPLRRVNPSIPTELERIVNKALSKEKSLRYQSCSALYKDLNKFLNVQYPDFSLQDFAIFMKSNYSAMYIENRKKMSEFAKITLSSLNNGERDPKNQIEGLANNNKGVDNDTKKDDTKRLVTAPPPHPEPQAEEPEPPPDAPDIMDQTNASVNLKDLQLKGAPLDRSIKRDPGIGGFSRVTTNTSTNYRVRSGTGSTIQRSAPDTSEPSSAAGTLAVIFFFLAVASFIGFKFGILPVEVLPRDFAIQTGLLKEPAYPLPERWEVASTSGQFSVFIETNPPGAQIYIDGVEHSERTPFQMKMAVNSQHRILLKKPGYADMERLETINHEGTSLSYNLRPAIPASIPASQSGLSAPAVGPATPGNGPRPTPPFNRNSTADPRSKSGG